MIKDSSPIIDGRSKSLLPFVDSTTIYKGQRTFTEDRGTIYKGNALLLKIIKKRTKTGVIKRALPMSAIKANTCAHRNLKGLG